MRSRSITMHSERGPTRENLRVLRTQSVHPGSRAPVENGHVSCWSSTLLQLRRKCTWQDYKC